MKKNNNIDIKNEKYYEFENMCKRNKKYNVTSSDWISKVNFFLENWEKFSTGEEIYSAMINSKEIETKGGGI